LAKSF